MAKYILVKGAEVKARNYKRQAFLWSIAFAVLFLVLVLLSIPDMRKFLFSN